MECSPVECFKQQEGHRACLIACHEVIIYLCDCLVGSSLFNKGTSQVQIVIDNCLRGTCLRFNTVGEAAALAHM